MTFLDMIEMYNLKNNLELNNMQALFADITLDERLDKDALIGVLLDQCGAMHCIYETTATFKYFSDNFFKKYAWNIGKLVDSWNFTYNPIENKKLDWTDTTSIEQNLDTNEDTTESRSKTNTGTQGTVYDEDQVNTISAMNSSSYEPDNKRETDGSSTRTDNLNESISATGNRDKDENLTWEETDTHTEHGTVNMPYQDLIEKERKQAQFNVYNWIANKYAKELFLLVY